MVTKTTVLGRRHQRDERYREEKNVGPFLDNNLTKTRVVLITIPESEMPPILPKMQHWVLTSMRVYAPIWYHCVTHLRNREHQTLQCFLLCLVTVWWGRYSSSGIWICMGKEKRMVSLFSEFLHDDLVTRLIFTAVLSTDWRILADSWVTDVSRRLSRTTCNMTRQV